MNSRNREATLLRTFLLRIFVELKDVGIYVYLLKAFIFREVFCERVKVYEHETYGASYLWCGESYSLAVCECLPHILNKCLKFWIVRSDILGNLSQYWLPISVNRKYQFKNLFFV